MRILLADAVANVRFALRVLLERQQGLQVLGEAASFAELFDQAHGECPDLVLMDWGLAGGVDLMSSLREVCPGLAVIALSGLPEARQEALAAGVHAFIGKNDPPEELLAAVRSVRRRYGRQWRFGGKEDVPANLGSIGRERD